MVCIKDRARVHSALTLFNSVTYPNITHTDSNCQCNICIHVGTQLVRKGLKHSQHNTIAEHRLVGLFVGLSLSHISTAGIDEFPVFVYLCPQGIMLVYDITQEQTFSNVSKWMRNIEEVRVTLYVYLCKQVCDFSV